MSNYFFSTRHHILNVVLTWNYPISLGKIVSTNLRETALDRPFWPSLVASLVGTRYFSYYSRSFPTNCIMNVLEFLDGPVWRGNRTEGESGTPLSGDLMKHILVILQFTTYMAVLTNSASIDKRQFPPVRPEVGSNALRIVYKLRISSAVWFVCNYVN